MDVVPFDARGVSISIGVALALGVLVIIHFISRRRVLGSQINLRNRIWTIEQFVLGLIAIGVGTVEFIALLNAVNGREVEVHLTLVAEVVLISFVISALVYSAVHLLESRRSGRRRE